MSFKCSTEVCLGQDAQFSHHKRFDAFMVIENNELILKNVFIGVSNNLYMFVVVVKLWHEVRNTLLYHLSLRVVIEEDIIWCGMAFVVNHFVARSRLSDIFQRHRMISRSWRWSPGDSWSEGFPREELERFCYSLRYIIRTPVRIICYRTHQFPLTRISRFRFISDHWFVSLCLKTAVLAV